MILNEVTKKLNDRHTNIHVRMPGFRVSSRFVTASVGPVAAVCVVCVCECMWEPGVKLMVRACPERAQQSGGMRLAVSSQLNPDLNTRLEMRPRGQDACGLMWLRGHCVFV